MYNISLQTTTNFQKNNNIKNIAKGIAQSKCNQPKGGPFNLKSKFVATLGSNIERVRL
jgi:hypothetical protein